MLLGAEPAGTLAPCVAGSVEVRATLGWRTPEEVPELPAFAPPDPEVARFSCVEVANPRDATRRLSGEVRALGGTALSTALEALMREITAFAALTEGTLELAAVREIPPRVASARSLELLARDVWEAGYSVRFAPSWTPSPSADAYLGVRGSEDLADFVRSHPSWHPA